MVLFRGPRYDTASNTIEVATGPQFGQTDLILLESLAVDGTALVQGNHGILDHEHISSWDTVETRNPASPEVTLSRRGDGSIV